MTDYFLGGDLGSTRTRVLIADANGQSLGYAEAGPGNHEVVGFEGVKTNLSQAIDGALRAAGLSIDQIAGAGFGISGYDWPIEYEPHINLIRSLGFPQALEIVNDTELGLLAGSPKGWGVAVVSGTGCNCRGWDETRTRRGRITGGGLYNGEFAGASELIFMTVRALAYEWTGRGRKSALSNTFVAKFGVRNLEELLQGINCQTLELEAADARLVFQVALDLVRWAGRELGELAVTVISQLGFQELDFDLVQIGSMFDGSPLLNEEMKRCVHTIAPGANFIRLQEPPVLGAVLLAMQTAGLKVDAQVRMRLTHSISQAPHQQND
jgi:N-acetylglucosamine kinase-like BadF-type ATPase